MCVRPLGNLKQVNVLPNNPRRPVLYSSECIQTSRPFGKSIHRWMLVSTHKKKMDAGSILNNWAEYGFCWILFPGLLLFGVMYCHSHASNYFVTLLSVVTFCWKRSWLKAVLIRLMTLGNTIWYGCSDQDFWSWYWVPISCHGDRSIPMPILMLQSLYNVIMLLQMSFNVIRTIHFQTSRLFKCVFFLSNKALLNRQPLWLVDNH